jgi:hypothetical protein
VPSCYNRRKRKKETTPAYIDIILYIYLKKSQLLFPKRSAHHPIASHSSVGGCSFECYCIIYTTAAAKQLFGMHWLVPKIHHSPTHTAHTQNPPFFSSFSFISPTVLRVSRLRERLSSARAWHSLYI